MAKITVIFPTYNERENIKKLILGVKQLINPFEIIVVDDNSPDKTWKIVQKLASKYENIHLIKRINKRGLASAISDGIISSKGDIIVWMDCDFSMPLETIPSLIKALGKSQIAIGSRYVKGGNDEREFSRVITSKLFNTFASLLLGRSIKDYTTGFVAAKREVFDALDLYGVYGEYCVIFLYKAKEQGIKILEVPYTCIPRTQGETKTADNFFNLLKHGLNYGVAVIKLWLNRGV